MSRIRGTREQTTDNLLPAGDARERGKENHHGCSVGVRCLLGGGNMALSLYGLRARVENFRCIAEGERVERLG